MRSRKFLFRRDGFPIPRQRGKQENDDDGDGDDVDVDDNNKRKKQRQDEVEGKEEEKSLPPMTSQRSSWIRVVWPNEQKRSEWGSLLSSLENKTKQTCQSNRTIETLRG